MFQNLKTLIRDEEGATMVEYGLMLALVAIVVGGLMFAFGEGAAKRTLAGVIFGVGMAVGAVNFMSWLFP